GRRAAQRGLIEVTKDLDAIRESGIEVGPKVASRVRLVFALVISAVFLDVIDFSIVQVALPCARTEFLVSLAESQWIVGVYGITMAGFLCSAGGPGTSTARRSCSSLASSCSPSLRSRAAWPRPSSPGSSQGPSRASARRSPPSRLYRSS